MEKLDQDLKDSYSFHSRLQTDIGNLEINMRERRNSKTSLSGFSVSKIVASLAFLLTHYFF